MKNKNLPMPLKRKVGSPISLGWESPFITNGLILLVYRATDSAITITETVTVLLSDVDDNNSTFPTSCGYAALDSISGMS